MIEFRWLAPTRTSAAARPAMRVAGLLTEKHEYQTTSIVDLPATWDEFLAGKSRNARREFRRSIKDAE